MAIFDFKHNKKEKDNPGIPVSPDSEKPTENPDRPGVYTYRYPRPSMTADCVVFGFDGEGLKLLLIERGIEPFKGYWALPGGFLREDETIEQCAARELYEETNLRHVYLDQFHVFSKPDRDPRERVVTVAFIALVNPSLYSVAGGDDAAHAAWFDLEYLPPLAFDHQMIIDAARAHLREIIRTRKVAFNLLQENFSADQLRKVYEAITGVSYDRRNFLRKMLQSGMVEEVDAPSAIHPEQCEDGLPGTQTCEASASMSQRRSKLYRRSQADGSDDAPDTSSGSTKNLFDF